MTIDKHIIHDGLTNKISFNHKGKKNNSLSFHINKWERTK